MAEIVFLDTSTLGDVPNVDIFSKLGKVTYFESTNPGDVIGHIGKAEIIVTNKVLITREDMESCPSLKLICISATGMNNVDLDAAHDLGILVRNAVGYSTQSVVQHTFAAIFQLYNRIRYYDNYVKCGEYAKSPIFTHYGPEITELAGKTMGIIGLGTIGKSVAGVAEAFLADVVYYSTSGKNQSDKYRSVSLEELLQIADIVSIHAPLNDNTRNLIGQKQLRSMKSAAILVNVGRGGIVVEHDLAEALDADRISGACIDVYEKEPIDADNPLLSLKNPDRVILTPHNAWASVEARVRLMEIVYRNIEEFLESGN